MKLARLASLVLVAVSGCGNSTPAAPVIDDSPAVTERAPDFDRVAPFAGDWARWRGSNQDGIAESFDLRTDWPEEMKATWQQDVGGGFSAVAIADGRVVTMGLKDGEEIVTALEATTGRLLWQAHYAANYEGISYGTGPRSTPTITGGKVYTQGATGIVHCFDLVSGDVLWRNDLRVIGECIPPGYGYAHSLLVKDNLVYVQPGGGAGKGLAALAADTGEVVWTAQDDAAGYSSPIAISRNDREEVVFFSGDRVVGVDPKTGAAHWRFPWTTDFHLNAATPIFFDGSLFISSSYGMGGALLRLNDSDTPELVWKNKIMKSHFSTPVLKDGYLFGFSDAILTCMEWASGKRVWTQRDYGKGSVVLVDDRLLVLSDEGVLALAAAAPERFMPEAETRVFQSRTWTVPVLTGGFLFVRDEHTLKAFDLR